MRINPDVGKATFKVGGGPPPKPRHGDWLRLFVMACLAVMLLLWALWSPDDEPLIKSNEIDNEAVTLDEMSLPDFAAAPLPSNDDLTAAASEIDFLHQHGDDLRDVLMANTAGIGWGLQAVEQDLINPPLPRGASSEDLLRRRVQPGSAVFISGAIEISETVTLQDRPFVRVALRA